MKRILLKTLLIIIMLVLDIFVTTMLEAMIKTGIISRMGGIIPRIIVFSATAGGIVAVIKHKPKENEGGLGRAVASGVAKGTLLVLQVWVILTLIAIIIFLILLATR